MTTFNYVATAQKPTAVTHSLTARFTSGEETNLILAKTNRLEIHTLQPHGLTPFLDVPIYGRISNIKAIHFPGETQEHLLVCTERFKFCVLSFDRTTQEIVTRAYGNTQDRVGVVSDIGQLTIIDPQTRAVGMHIYDGVFKVIPINETQQFMEAFNTRLEDPNVLDIVFMHGTTLPTIAVLFEDAYRTRHVKSYAIDIKTKDSSPTEFVMQNLDNGANKLIAPLCGGLIVVGESTICHFDGKDQRAIYTNSTEIEAIGQIDDHRYLLGDYMGNLSLLGIDISDGTVQQLTTESLGKTTIPSTISYLDSGVVFVGSTLGDSQLIRLGDTPSAGLVVEESFTNLGPIVDFCLVDSERQGQARVVTCSGGYKHGSLRVIRNGIGMQIQANIELPGIHGLFSLKQSSDDDFDKYLVQSFVSETRILGLSGETLEEMTIPGMDANAPSLLCQNVIYNQFLQVTPSSVRLIDASSCKMVDVWSPTQGQITVTCASSSQLLLSTGGGIVQQLSISQGKLVHGKAITFDNEVACMDVSSFGSEENAQQLVAIGFWHDMTVRLISSSTFETIGQAVLDGDVMARSLMLSHFEGAYYLLCGLGDGKLVTFTLDPTAQTLLTNKKVICLGTQPLMLRRFRAKHATHVFAASDRPTVIYSYNKKLLYANVNHHNVSNVCSFHTEMFPDCLALSNDAELSIGTIDDIQKLHIQTVPLGEHPRRICHSMNHHTFCVLTVRHTTGESQENMEECFVKLFDDQTLELLASFPLDTFETAASLTCCTFESDTREYFVVGTAYALPDEMEPSKGRILVFSSQSTGDLQLVAQYKTNGCVYSLCPFHGRLLASVNNKLELLKWTEAGGNLDFTEECSKSCQVLNIFVKTRGEFILVGDLMKSVTLYIYKSVDSSIEEITHDYSPNWMSCGEMLNDDTFICSENAYNLFTAQKNLEATTDVEKQVMKIVGEYHLGSFVNAIHRGSLVMRLPEIQMLASDTFIYATVDGSIGIIANISLQDYEFLRQLEGQLNAVVRGVGGFIHSEWRSFANERRVNPCHGYIDGDLIEMLLELPASQVQDIASAMSMTAEHLIERVEGFARLH